MAATLPRPMPTTRIGRRLRNFYLQIHGMSSTYGHSRFALQSEWHAYCASKNRPPLHQSVLQWRRAFIASTTEGELPHVLTPNHCNDTCCMVFTYSCYSINDTTLQLKKYCLTAWAPSYAYLITVCVESSYSLYLFFYSIHNRRLHFQNTLLQYQLKSFTVLSYCHYSMHAMRLQLECCYSRNLYVL